VWQLDPVRLPGNFQHRLKQPRLLIGILELRFQFLDTLLGRLRFWFLADGIAPALVFKDTFALTLGCHYSSEDAASRRNAGKELD